nr:immunoglobulin heavy chain junction region [Mus musculus]
NWWALTTGAK